MNKQILMWLGVAVVGIGGYMLWKKSQDKNGFSGAEMPTTNGIKL